MTYPNETPGNAGTFAAPPAEPYPGQFVVPQSAMPTREPMPRARESKSALKATEFYAYLGAVIAVVATSFYFSADDGQPDEFTADQALRYITWLTIGYMVARGLAKAGRPQFSGRDDY